MDGTRIVLVKPGDVLAIGNLGSLAREPEELEQATARLGHLKDTLGLAGVLVFEADIDLALFATRALADPTARLIDYLPHVERPAVDVIDYLAPVERHVTAAGFTLADSPVPTPGPDTFLAAPRTGAAQSSGPVTEPTPRTRKVSIRGTGTASHQVIVDGVDLSHGLAGLTLRLDIGTVPKVTLDVQAYGATSVEDVEAQVILSPDSHDALVALGWTPPDDPAAPDTR